MSSTRVLRRRTIFSTALAIAAMLLPAASSADEVILERDGYGPRGATSFGVMLGEPTGLSLEKNLRSGNAWDLGLGVVYGPGLRLHGDYLFTVGGARVESGFFMRFQIGVGALVGSLTKPCQFYGTFGCDNGIYAGARVPFAVEFWPRAPVNFGLQIAPVIAFDHNGTAGFLDAFAFLRFVL